MVLKGSSAGPIIRGVSPVTFDAVVGSGENSNYSTLQAADDVLDAGPYTLWVKQATYAAGLVVSTNDVYIFVEPGTTISDVITLSGNNVTLVLGAGCDVQGIITLSGVGCSLVCENGCDIDGILMSGNYGYVNGGGWETISNSGTAMDAVLMSGTDCIVENIALQTTGGSFDGVYTTGARAVIRNCKVVDSHDNGISIVSADCTIEGNLILDASAIGIAVFSPRARVVGNHTISAGDIGIKIAGGGDNSVFTGNIVQDQTNDSIDINAAGEDCVVVANRLDGAVDDNSGTSTVASNDETAF